MNYLIDGYNLLHALWAIGRKVGPRGLRKARLALLGLLQQTFADEAANVTVVFDAAGAPPGLAGEEFHEKIHVRYAVHEEEADDLIEALIRRESAPQNLTVVSDDHRIQQAARRGQCVPLGCGDFLDRLADHRPRNGTAADAAPTPPKPEKISEEEVESWLKEFGDLEDDPHFKALLEPPEWWDLDKDAP